MQTKKPEAKVADIPPRITRLILGAYAIATTALALCVMH